MHIPRFEHPPVIDGLLDEEVWRRAAVLGAFLQTEPGDNIKASHPTQVLLGYDDDLNRNGFSPFTGQYEPGFRRNSRTFFIKMSYLLRRSF